MCRRRVQLSEMALYDDERVRASRYGGESAFGEAVTGQMRCNHAVPGVQKSGDERLKIRGFPIPTVDQHRERPSSSLRDGDSARRSPDPDPVFADASRIGPSRRRQKLPRGLGRVENDFGTA